MAARTAGNSPEDVLVGGQAVIEGVMMRTPRAYAVAVRHADGSIEIRREAVRRLADLWRPLSWPVVRGFAVLVQSLVLGIRTLNFSFQAASADVRVGEGAPDIKTGKKGSENLAMAGTMTLSAGFAVLLFILAPLWITTWLKGYLAAVQNWYVFNLVDGVIRVAFFAAYILAIRRMKDILRVFQYHGAEHKVVHTWEAGEELCLENARRKSPLHPRCGTSFLLFVMVVSIVVFSLFKVHGFLAIFLSRVLLIPLIAGLSYELIRQSARRCRSRFFRWLTLPGLSLQRLTTQEPSDDQLEVAIRALQEALAVEKEQALQAQEAA